MTVTFRTADCQACEPRARCTRAKKTGRTLTVYPREAYHVQEQARARQQTDEFKALYGERAGIEGTISQGVRAFGLRHARYLGLAKTHLQHVATAAAINVVRVVDWLTGEQPEGTRPSALQALAA